MSKYKCECGNKLFRTTDYTAYDVIINEEGTTTKRLGVNDLADMMCDMGFELVWCDRCGKEAKEVE